MVLTAEEKHQLIKDQQIAETQMEDYQTRITTAINALQNRNGEIKTADKSKRGFGGGKKTGEGGNVEEIKSVVLAVKIYRDYKKNTYDKAIKNLPENLRKFTKTFPPMDSVSQNSITGQAGSGNTIEDLERSHSQKVEGSRTDPRQDRLKRISETIAGHAGVAVNPQGEVEIEEFKEGEVKELKQTKAKPRQPVVIHEEEEEEEKEEVKPVEPENPRRDIAFMKLNTRDKVKKHFGSHHDYAMAMMRAKKDARAAGIDEDSDNMPKYMMSQDMFDTGYSSTSDDVWFKNNEDTPITTISGETEGLGAVELQKEAVQEEGKIKVDTDQSAKETDAPAALVSTAITIEGNVANVVPDNTHRAGGGTDPQIRHNLAQKMRTALNQRYDAKIANEAHKDQFARIKRRQRGHTPTRFNIDLAREGGTEERTKKMASLVAPIEPEQLNRLTDEEYDEYVAREEEFAGMRHEPEMHGTDPASIPLPTTMEGDPAMKPTAQTTGIQNVLMEAGGDGADIPKTSKELFEGVGKESTAIGKSIDQLKNDIKYFHSIYDKFIPEFSTTSHKKNKDDALKSKNIEVVKIHYNQMENIIKKYYQEQSGIKLGVVISADAYIRNYLKQHMPMQQPVQPVQPVPPVIPPVVPPTQPEFDPADLDFDPLEEEFGWYTGDKTDDETRRRLVSQEQTAGETKIGEQEVKKADESYTQGGNIFYRKSGDPYDYKSVEQHKLVVQGGMLRANRRAAGKPLKTLPIKANTGYINDRVLRIDDRTGYQRFLNDRVIKRFNPEYKIKG